MLLKPTGSVPHVGGVVFTPGEPYYELIRDWIADGARLDLATPRVTAITIAPSDPAILRIGGKQQMRVVATYTDGTRRDVTREAYIESGNGEVATAARPGLITSLRRGEAPILARFEGAYAATTLTVMGDRSGFVWTPPPAYGKIDELVAAKWQRLKILPSEVCNDADFIRRASLDLTGLPPSEEELQAFLSDTRDSRAKREELVDRLVGSKGYIEYWTNKWADLLDVNRKFLGVEGAVAYRKWIREQVARNTPYDQFARAILTASGSNLREPAGLVLQDPPRARRDDGEHDAVVHGGPVQLQQVPRPPLRALDSGPVLPDRGLLRAGRAQGRSRVQGPAARRHGRREGEAAV